MNADELLSFEEHIAAIFNRGEIPYPVHLASGNENSLIDVFKEVREEDWIFGAWRLHSHALLKGVPPAALEAAIRRGESMALRFEKERVYGSAIAGGTIPIALGAAQAIKMYGRLEMVWLFVGDMMAKSGIYHESMQYAYNFNLPITFVIEDNGMSVCTDTREAWGTDKPITCNYQPPRVIHYHYRSKWPHCGAGQRVQF